MTIVLPDGVPTKFDLAKIIVDVRDGRYKTAQELALAHHQGERWLKQLYKAALSQGLLPTGTTHRKWLDLFPTTRRLSAEEVEERKRRLTGIKQIKPTSQQRAEQRKLEQQEWEYEHGLIKERAFSDLSLGFILSTYKYEDLQTDKKRIVKEKLAEVQKGVCMVCRKPFSTDRVPHLDHCHETGNVRGLLCSFCNMGLGSFQDSILSLENAIKYLLDNMKVRIHGTA